MMTVSPSAEARRVRTVRLLAAAAAAVTAGLYLLIGFGVLEVGEASTGGTPDLFAFGALLGGVFAVTAALLARFASRLLWIGVAVLQIIVIVGYVAMAGVRVPAVEVNGLLIKAAQAVVFVAVAWLIANGRSAASTSAIWTRR